MRTSSDETEAIGASLSLLPHRPSVLIVDDNQANLTALEALLSALDVDVVRAASGEEALKRMLVDDFAVVLMDVQMPELDGFQTTALIRQRDRNRHTPIIFVTAIFKDDASAKKAYSLGAIDYLTKPFDDDVLKAKVAALTNQYRQADVIGRQAEALRSKEQEARREHQAREVAEAENHAKDQFLSVLSHELRSPLNSIIGWASLLRGEKNLSPRASKAIDAVLRSAQAQSKMVDDLIDVSQIASQTLTIESLPVDLVSVTQAAIATMQPAAGERGIRIELDVAPGSYSLSGDRDRLEQLVCSLLSNATKFSSPGGVVTIELSHNGAGIQLRVKDIGIGISAQMLPHVFEAFRQNDSSWTRRHGGLGIGLTVARHLAELHGGTIEAFSAGEGFGAVFVLTLPSSGATATTHAVAPSTKSAIPAAGPDALPLRNLRILVVDDDADARELLTTMLAETGAAVESAPSAKEAIARFTARPFDVVLSDLGMPDQDGLWLVRKLRALDAPRGGALKAVAISGYGSFEDRRQATSAGFDAHLTKPCDGRDLFAALAQLTGR